LGQWFLNVFGSTLKKLLNKKILLAFMKTIMKIMNTETFTESRHRIFPRLTLSVTGWFSLRDHLSLDRGKVGNLRSIFQNNMHPGYGASFTVTGGFLNAATSSLKRVTEGIFKISKCFQRSKPRLYLPKTIGAYTESTD
jgi:hypothetical protein